MTVLLRYVGRCIKNEAHAAHMDACCGAGFMRGIFPVIYVWKGSGVLYAVQRLFQRDCRFIPSNHQYCLRHFCLRRGTGGLFSDDAGGSAFENRQFAGKLLLLLLLNVLSAGLAICLYLAGLKFVLHINDLPYLLFLKEGRG